MTSRFYRCRMCGFILDIHAGVTEEQAHGAMDSVLPPDSSRQGITDLPVIWMCPECQSSQEDFEDYPEGEIDFRMTQPPAPTGPKRRDDRMGSN